ncbi:high mobility group [Coemansia sp. RSA 1250]|nr:high mobility group [Coemansia sp. RSA 1250]
MPLITLSSEDCEMIEKCVDMISMQCRMIGNMLRRSREASGVQPASHDVSPPESNEGMVDMLNNAVSTLASTVRQVSTEMGAHEEPPLSSRKRSRIRHEQTHPEAFDDPHIGNESTLSYATTPPAAKRRGRPPRDYGDELGPAFAVYASENYYRTEQGILERTHGPPGTRPSKHEVLRALWDTWWLSGQNVKDKYLGISRHEMAVNETHMLELLVEYPLPSEASAAQAGLRGPARTISRSPELASPFDLFMREQIPLLRSKVPDWNDAEIHRRLTASWNTMSSSDREKYNAATTLASASSASHGALNTTPTSSNTALRAPPSGTGSKHGGRAPSQSTPRRAYVLFCRQERPLLVQANPDWDLPMVNKELGRKWKELTPEQKEVYHELERKEYDTRMAAAGSSGMDSHGGQGYSRSGSFYSGISTPTGGSRSYNGEVSFVSRSGKSGALGSGNPHKGPSKAYVFYSRLNRKNVTTEHPEWDLATVNRELGRMWKALSLEERQTWEARAAASAAGTGEVESTVSTPHARDSPAISLQAATSAVTPSPIPAALSTNSDNASLSLPASGTATPTAKEDVVMSNRSDYDGEGEAEDIEMQDDDNVNNRSKSATGPSSSVMSSSESFSSTAAPIVLPKHQPSSFSVATSMNGPPPTAKPAVVSNGANSTMPSLQNSYNH